MAEKITALCGPGPDPVGDPGLPGPVHPDEWMILPDDLWTHLHDWRTACTIAKRCDTDSADNAAYWQKQIDTLDKIRAAMVSKALCKDEGCDHHGTEHVCVEQPLAATGIGSVPWYGAAERAEFQFLANTITEAIKLAEPANMSSWRVAEKIALQYAKDGSFFERFKP